MTAQRSRAGLGWWEDDEARPLVSKRVAPRSARLLLPPSK
jgi:hypothetical protein